MDIRRLLPTDAAIFRALRLAALQESPSAFGSSDEEERAVSIPTIEARLTERPDRGVFGAFHGDELVGLAALGRESLDKLAHKAFVWGLYVSPEYRGRGIARSLMAEVLGLARAAPGVLQVNLSVNASHVGAIRLYESFGFRSFGLEAGALNVSGVLHDEQHMSLHLVERRDSAGEGLADGP